MLASTSSPENSGLYADLLPRFRAETGITVRVVAVGTGRALDMARRGDADLVIVHDEQSELAFVRGGYGIQRRTVMYNDYILVGPRTDPAGIKSRLRLSGALEKIASGKATFISRGDESGTHKRERALWRMTSVKNPAGQWYIEAGRGMGGTLNMANELGAYTLSDRATWASFGNKKALMILIENHPPLDNPYSVILVNPDKHPHTRHRAASVFSDWLVSERGQRYIRDFKINGEQLFFPTPPSTQ